MIEDVTGVRYIHYGGKHFNKDVFKPAYCRALGGIPKPKGGLWASRVDAENGWRDWCKSEDFRHYEDDDCFIFTIHSDRVYVIRSAEDGELFRNKYSLGTVTSSWLPFDQLDWNRISEDYDAVELVISDDSQLYWDFYGWDCDSIVIFKPDIVMEEVKVNV